MRQRQQKRSRKIVFAVLFWQTITEGSVDAPRFYAVLSSIFAEPDLWQRIAQELMAFPNIEVRRVIGEIEMKREKAGGEFSGIMGKLFEALRKRRNSGSGASAILPARRVCRPGAAKIGARARGWDRDKATEAADREAEA